jgi:hypothetical protein
MKIYILLTFIYILGIYSDFLNDDYYDIMNCIGTDTNKCSSTKLKTKDLECCLFDVTYLDSSYEDEDEDAKICSAVFTTYVSQSMMKQIEAIATEYYGILKAYGDIDIPRLREKITCSSTSATYEFGGYQYTSSDIQKLKSKNHCLYYYFNSIGQNLFSDTAVSISKDKCINAESLDVTKDDDIYCAYADVAILYSDNTKTEFKTCYFLPSESIKSKKLDPTTESALQSAAQKEASKSGKIFQEYEAKLVDKKGRSITYNSVKGIVETSNSKYYSIKFPILILFSLILL